MPGGARRPPAAPAGADALAARGGGNPMFLEALVREAGRSGSVADLPESVEGLVTSQIDRLDPSDRTVLRYAAVLGMVVDEEALGTLLHDHAAGLVCGRRPGAVSEQCGAAATAGVLRPGARSAAVPAPLMRDVAYEGLPFSRRKLLHEQVGHGDRGRPPAPEAQCELAVAALLPRRALRQGLALLGGRRRAGAREVRQRRGHRLLRARRRGGPTRRRYPRPGGG